MRSLKLLVVSLVAVLVAASLAGPSAAQAPDCGPVLSPEDLEAGDVGDGLTVETGTEPEPFAVEVLGVLRDGVAPGRDMIIVEVSGPQIDRAGGIWAGMSGSPVYIGDALIGAVAYGFSASPSPIAGLTPATDMVALVGDDAFQQAQPRPADEVTFGGALAAEVNARAGSAYHGATATLRRLPMPLAVSGLGTQRLDDFGDAIGDAGLAVRAVPGSAADFGQAPAAPPEPGGNFAAALSYGDITAAGVGTTTLVCDGQAIAFGHPFNLSGPTTLGASGATALTVIRDDTFGPFKLANIGAPFGTVDQDRFAGIRANIGALPDTVPVRTHVTDLDTGRSRDGQTDVVDTDFLPDLAFATALAGIDTTIDRIGPGSSRIAFTVTGDAAETGPFTLERENVFASDFDVSFESVFELANQIAALSNLTVDEVTFDAVEIEADVTEAVERLRLVAARVGVDGAEPVDVTQLFEIQVEPGSTITIEADLDPGAGGDLTTVSFDLVVPQEAVGFGFLDISGGGFGLGEVPTDDCVFDPDACAEGGVPGLIERLAGAPRNDDVVARLTVSPVGEPVPPQNPDDPDGPTEPPTGPEPLVVESRQRVDDVATGAFGVSVFVIGDGCAGCPATVDRVAGPNRIETAVALSQTTFETAEQFVLARADDYSDALVGAPLAAQRGGPVLLTETGALSDAVIGEIARLGATTAVLVGATGTFGAAIDDALTAAGITTIERVEGADRYEVAGNVARAVGGDSVLLVEGDNPDPARGWPDALGAAALGATLRAPILFTGRDNPIPQATLVALSDLGTEQITIVGGTAAISEGVATELADAGYVVERVGGATRYETSVELAFRTIGAGAVGTRTFLATGLGWADALAAGPATAAAGGVLLLVDGRSLDGSPPARDWAAGLAFSGAHFTVVGGEAAISLAVEEEIRALLDGGFPPPEEPPMPL